MMVPFPASRLRDSTANEAVFLTTVAAAEAFVRQRQAGRYRDVIALVEFGDEAYVVTPFTTDYDNVLLSLSLVGDWTEYMQFPDGGTAIGQAIVRGTELFKAFDFLRASGNVMVIFSDGQDTQVTTGKMTLDQVLAAAVSAKVPVYLIRTGRDRALGEVVPDAIWKPAVESTGGRFFAAATESDLIRAIAEIDERSSGTIDVKRYSVERPRFAMPALAAAVLWAMALVLKVSLPFFSRFP
jgi:Ca-activated chloride channel family protein